LDDWDRERFLETIGEVYVKTGWEVHAWCLMDLVTLFIDRLKLRIEPLDPLIECFQFPCAAANELQFAAASSSGRLAMIRQKYRLGVSG
jgi:hypothetical protein